MNRKKILYINHSRFFGGSESSLLDIITHLNKDEFEPVVISPQNLKLQKGLERIGIKRIIFNNKVLSYESLSIYRSIRCKNNNILLLICFTAKWLVKILLNLAGGIRLSFLIRKIDPDLLHANNWLSAQYIAPFLKNLKIPSIFHLRDFDEGRLNRLMDPVVIGLLSKFDRAIATSKAGYRFFKKMEGFPAGKVQLIYNSIDLSYFDKTGYASSHSSSIPRELEDTLKGHFVFMLIGQLCEGKGQRYFIQAAGDVVKIMPEALFLIAGEDFERNGKNTQELMQLIKDKGLSGKARLIGYHEDIRPILLHSDIIVAPSLEEAFGRVAVESMAMEKPVIASDIESLREIIEDNISGILVEPADYKKLASAMIELAKDKDKMQALADNARGRVKEKFDISKRIKEIEKLYSDLLKER